MTWIDLERQVFSAIFYSYMFWFFPPKPCRFVRLLGNCLLAVHFIAVGFIGTILAKDIYTNIRPSSYQESGAIPELTQQIIMNTGRLDRLEEQKRTDTALLSEMMKSNGDMKLQIGLVQQEIFLYRWGLGIIYVVLVGQLGVAVFSLLMRRENERQERHENQRHHADDMDDN